MACFFLNPFGLLASPGFVPVGFLGFTVFVTSAVCVVYALLFAIRVTLVTASPTDDVILVDLLGFHLGDGLVIHVAHNFGLYVCFRLHSRQNFGVL